MLMAGVLHRILHFFGNTGASTACKASDSARLLVCRCLRLLEAGTPTGAAAAAGCWSAGTGMNSVEPKRVCLMVVARAGRRSKESRSGTLVEG